MSAARSYGEEEQWLGGPLSEAYRDIEALGFDLNIAAKVYIW